MPRGRRVRNADFLATLRDISGYENVSSFARACGKQTSNMSQYLRGTVAPGTTVIRSAVENLYGWQVRPITQVQPIPARLSSLPTVAGIYVIYDSAGNVLYLGKATNLRAEIRQALRRQIPVGVRLGPHLRKTRPAIRDLAERLSLFAVPSPRIRHNVEALLLRVFVNQTHNTNIGTFT
jgi:hypothetical protein